MNSAPAAVPFGFRRDLPRWRQLVTPAWLASLLAGQPCAAAPAGRWCLLEVGNGTLAQFEAGHIEGARYLDTARLERPPTWNCCDDAALLQLLLEYGIGHDVTVLLYGRNMLAAARAAHLLLYAGVHDVRLVDGGLAAWRLAGLALLRGSAPATAAPLAQFGGVFPGRPELMLDMVQVRAMQQADGVLVSIRTWSEFIGETSGYSYISARGEIPAALWGRAGDDGDVDSMSQFHDGLGRMKPAADIARMWRAGGILPEQQLVFYCGTGWRASLAWFYAWLMGWQHIAVYDGGWCEWSRDSANPQLCRVRAALTPLPL
ncbi:sulfurtransferase [Massilia sp. PWRC2]|uniref:sulfurtransferase n=1 Tax=Massilia sp. PWRC2 TaxID=2804626 RepID=UPI003CEF27B7